MEKHQEELERSRINEERERRAGALEEYGKRHTVVVMDPYVPAPHSEQPTNLFTTNRGGFEPEFVLADDEESDPEMESLVLASDDGFSGDQTSTSRSRCRTEYNRSAHSTLRDATAEDEQLWTRNENIFYPFAGPKDFVLARYFVRNNITQAAVNEYFNAGLGRAPILDAISDRDTAFEAITFKSWHDLKKKMEVLAADSTICNLDWNRGTVSYGALSRNKGKAVSYLYRDITGCVQFLLEQPCFEQDLTFEAVREFNEDGERVYGELNSGDWWWRVQVSAYAFQSSANGY